MEGIPRTLRRILLTCFTVLVVIVPILAVFGLWRRGLFSEQGPALVGIIYIAIILFSAAAFVVAACIKSIRGDRKSVNNKKR